MSFDFFQSECALVHYREEQRLAKKALVSSTILLYLNKFLHYSLQPGKNWQHAFFLYSLTSKRSILYFRMHNEPWICCTNSLPIVKYHKMCMGKDVLIQREKKDRCQTNLSMQWGLYFYFYCFYLAIAAIFSSHIYLYEERRIHYKNIIYPSFQVSFF